MTLGRKTGWVAREWTASFTALCFAVSIVPGCGRDAAPTQPIALAAANDATPDYRAPYPRSVQLKDLVPDIGVDHGEIELVELTEESAVFLYSSATGIQQVELDLIDSGRNLRVRIDGVPFEEYEEMIAPTRTGDPTANRIQAVPAAVPIVALLGLIATVITVGFAIAAVARCTYWGVLDFQRYGELRPEGFGIGCAEEAVNFVVEQLLGRIAGRLVPRITVVRLREMLYTVLKPRFAQITHAVLTAQFNIRNRKALNIAIRKIVEEVAGDGLRDEIYNKLKVMIGGDRLVSGRFDVLNSLSQFPCTGKLDITGLRLVVDTTNLTAQVEGGTFSYDNTSTAPECAFALDIPPEPYPTMTFSLSADSGGKLSGKSDPSFNPIYDVRVNSETSARVIVDTPAQEPGFEWISSPPFPRSVSLTLTPE